VIKLRFTTACDDLAARGKRAVLLGSWVFLYKFEHQSMKRFGKRFQPKVQPVLLYAAEIWGLEDDYCYQIENKHSFALTIILRVGQMTQNNMIYRYTARYPVCIFL